MRGTMGESGGGVPPGHYTIIFEEIEIVQTPGGEFGEEYWKWKFKVAKGEYVNAVLFLNTSPTVGQKSKAGKLLASMYGVEPSAGLKWDTEELHGRQFFATLVQKGDYANILPESVMPAETEEGKAPF